jgi:molecular chaperone DnaK
MPSVIPVGIDLGTTLSAVSYVDGEGQTQLVRNSRGEYLTPSVVLFQEECIKVGADAWELATELPACVAENVKRDMGYSYYRRKIQDQNYPPEVIQGCILRQIQKEIAGSIHGEYAVVITVPAYFDEARRKATSDAGVMSGLPVLDIVNEPTAAALAFGERLGYLSAEGAPAEQLTLLVYDLGGGTFDVTIMQLSSKGVTTLATDGDYELGGIHWDERLAEYASQKFAQIWPDADAISETDRLRLIRAAQGVKHELSHLPIAMLEFESAGWAMKLPVSRQEFESLTSDLVARTVFTTNQALREAKLLWHQIDRLLLVGGSTRMPAVRKAMQEASGLIPDDAVHPDEAVARGAAIYARFLLGARGIDPTVPKLRVRDVNSHGLGIEGVNQETLRIENVTVIPRNTPLPLEVVRQFVTKVNDQRSVKVQLLEGNSSMPEQCSRLAVAAIKNLPPGLPAGSPIQVKYRIEANGRLHVEANVIGHGTEAKIELARVRGLSDQKVRQWREVICRDGGYRDFEDVVESLLSDASTPAKENNSPLQNEVAPTTEESARPQTLAAAVDFGAPQAAAVRLLRFYEDHTSAQDRDEEASEAEDKSEEEFKVRRIRRRPGKDLPVIVNLLGHLTAGALGLTLGYLLLCWVRPDLNFLELSLPWISPSVRP